MKKDAKPDPHRIRSALIPVVAFVFGRAIACCAEAGRLTSEGRDRKLTLRERLSMRIHNRICGECRKYVRHIEILGELTRMTPPCPPLPEAAKKKLADALRADRAQ